MRARLETFVTAATAVATILVTLQLVDTATSGGLRRAMRRVAAATRDAARPRVPVPSPEDVTALLSEASRITREAATDR